MPTLEEIYKGDTSKQFTRDVYDSITGRMDHNQRKVNYNGKSVDPYEIALERSQGKYIGFGHNGRFSLDNPYYSQLALASGQDADALFEKAINWEADRATLLEQREYEDPSAQIARQRRAGINPDLQGGGSSGISSGSTSSQPQTQGSTEFKNEYKEQELSNQRTANVASMLSSTASIISSVVGGVGSVAQLPAQLKMMSVQSNIAEQTQDAVIQNTKNAATISGQQVTANALSNIGSSISNLSRISGLFTSETTDEDIGNVLTTLGYPSDQIGPTTNAIRQYQTNPVFKSIQAQNTRDYIDNEAYNSVMTSDVVGGLYEFVLQLTNQRNSLDKITNSITLGIQEALNNPEYIGLVASNTVKAEQATGVGLSLGIKQLSYDVSAFAHNVQYVKNAYDFNKKRIASIYDECKKQGRKPTTVEIATINTLTYKNMELRSLGSSQLDGMWNLLNQSEEIVFRNSYQLDGMGKLNPVVPFNRRFDAFSRYTFGQHLSEDNTAKDIFGAFKGYAPKQLQPLLNFIE